MSNDHWNTPQWIKDMFNGYFDPCPNDPQVNGLAIDWKEFNYVNPPYSQPLDWVLKAIEENKKGKFIVMLLRMDTSTRWFSLLQEAEAEFLWFAGRLHFSDTGKPANFPSMLVVLKKKIEELR